MAGKNRKAAQHVGEDMDERSEASVDMQAIMKLMLEGNEKADARRVADALEADRRAEARSEKAAADKLAEEDRAEARRIAAEDRAEARRRADKIAEEERAELRAEAKRARELEERIAAEERAEVKRARRVLAEEEAEKAKERAAQIASDRLIEQQEVLAAKQYEQQRALMCMQAEIGKKAAAAHRVEQTASRKRDRAIASIPSHRQCDDIEEFLLTAERRLGAGEVPEREWLVTLASKLSGKTGSMWQDLCAVCDSYQEVKAKLLKVCGYTAKVAAELFFGYKPDQVKGMTADQLYHRGVQLFRRLVAPHKVGEEAEFAILKGWVSSVVPKRARTVLDARAVTNVTELVEALQDHLMMEGDRTEGQAVVFRRQAHGSNEGSGERKGTSGASGVNCYKCGKPGHKAFECWQNKGSTGSTGGSYKPAVASSSTPSTVICYTCGEEGHKSPQCPRIKKEKVSPKSGEPKPVRQLWHYDATDTVLEGKVNGKKSSV